MSLPINHMGQRFGKLLVAGYAGGRKGKAEWLCICDCGRNAFVTGDSLRRNGTKSCGCAQQDAVRTHRMSRTSFYKRWSGMWARCSNQKHREYKNYGGRGIRVCSRWESFENFKSDMFSTYKEELSLERIDNDGNYCPENCKWATTIEQANNTRNARRFLVLGNHRKVKELASSFKMSVGLLAGRIQRGWPIHFALTMPKLSKRDQKQPDVRRLIESMVSSCVTNQQ